MGWPHCEYERGYLEPRLPALTCDQGVWLHYLSQLHAVQRVCTGSNVEQEDDSVLLRFAACRVETYLSLVPVELR